MQVRWEDTEGRLRGEILRFTGRLMDHYEEENRSPELYECPDGYRVFEENHAKQESALNPSEVDPFKGDWSTRRTLPRSLPKSGLCSGSPWACFE